MFLPAFRIHLESKRIERRIECKSKSKINVQKNMEETQCGFGKTRSTQVHINTVRLIIDKAVQQRRQIHV